jgi:hypothetical protein
MHLVESGPYQSVGQPPVVSMEIKDFATEWRANEDTGC